MSTLFEQRFNPQPNTQVIVFEQCALFEECLAVFSRDPKIANMVRQFIAAKTDNPLQPFGSKDRPYSGGGNFRGFIHVGLTFDVSLIYKMSGRGPTRIQLYAIVTHDQSGTGTPPNLRRQKQLRSKLDSQTF